MSFERTESRASFLHKNMHLELSSQIQKRLTSPHLWVVIWLVFLAGTIWVHAKKTNQPPVYDAMTYYEKARNFWGSIRSRAWQNPLDIEPTFRPPGTILMSYPFGFRKDFHGFYFRSAFIPILLVVLSVYVAGYSSQLRPLDQWDLALLAIFLSVLPAYYHFEITNYDYSSTYWGLVDVYLAGMASLAAATSIRAVKTCSRKWLALAVFVAAFCLLIKPAGVFVMICVGTGYIVALVARLLLTKETQQKRDVRNLLIYALVFIAVVDGIVVLGCLHSKYLSQDNLLFGKAAVAIMRTAPNIPWSLLPKFLLSQFGWVLPVTTVLMGVALISYWRRIDPAVIGYGPGSLASLLFFSSLCIMVGVWFWIIWSGGITQVRYFSPFGFMAVICTVPFFSVVLRRLPPMGRITFWGMWLAAVGNMAFLLVLREPPVSWQSATGVNLSTTGYETELRASDAFFQQMLDRDKNIYAYSLYTNEYVSMIESALYFKSSLHNYQPYIFIRRPIDWSRPSAVRVTELLDSDYILFAPVPEATKAAALSKQTVTDVWDQTQVFDSWLTDLNASNGVETVFQTSRARLVKIADASKLEASLSKLVQDHQWPKSFLEANPQRWWKPDQLMEEIAKNPSPVRDLNFGDVFKVQAVSLEGDEKAIRVRIWLEPSPRSSSAHWFMFFHQIDAENRIIRTEELLLPEQLPKNPKECLMETITLNVTEPHALHAVAIGIRDDDRVSHYLHADKGVRDWDNIRVVIPVRLPEHRILQSHVMTDLSAAK